MELGEGEVIVEEAGQASRFSTFVSILIAVVSVLGAILAWRVAVASSNASSTDTRALLAEADRADVNLQASITVFGHKAVYVSFVTNKSLAAAFEALGSSYQPMAFAFNSAAARTLDFMPRVYLDRDEKFDVARDLSETAADYSLNRNTNPQPLYDAADRARAKALWLLLDLIWFSGALVALTLADAIRNPLRYFCLLGGVGIMFSGSLAAVLIERAIP
jgi:hypothetical protein